MPQKGEMARGDGVRPTRGDIWWHLDNYRLDYTCPRGCATTISFSSLLEALLRNNTGR